MGILKKSADVAVLSGNVTLGEISWTTFHWEGEYRKDHGLVFAHAYTIEHCNEGINNCVYTVHGRKFTDLSFVQGKTIQQFSEGHEIREHEDGTRFLFVYKELPTFDSGDRVWGSTEHIAVYSDKYGINLIRCEHGYAIPRIYIYVGLTNIPPVFEEWVKILGCEDKVR